MCGVIAKPQLVMTDSISNEIISLSASHHTFGRDIHQYHKSECTAGMMISPKKGSYCYPHEKVKQWYFLVLSLRTSHHLSAVSLPFPYLTFEFFTCKLRVDGVDAMLY